MEPSRAGCYRHLATEQVRTERQAEEKRAVSEIRAIHAEHQGAYGAPRVHAELRARGRRINRKRVTRLMRINHIVGRHLRKKKRTTIADRAAPPTPDLVMRDFTADTNGLLRQYFPKGTDLSRWSFTDLEAVAMAINNRPRKTLGWRTPAEVFEEQLRSLQQPGVATTG